MKTKIVRMGNSRGVRIPKPLLEQTGIERDVILEVKAGELIIRPAKAHPREGWEEDARAIHEAGEDKLLLGEFPNEWDEEGWEWPGDRSASKSTSSSSTPQSGGKSRKAARASSSRRMKSTGN